MSNATHIKLIIKTIQKTILENYFLHHIYNNEIVFIAKIKALPNKKCLNNSYF